MRNGSRHKVAVVTGASSGIGQAVAAALTGAGARVLLTARNPDRLQKLARKIGHRAAFVPADLRSARSVAHLIEETTRLVGTPQILINLAGVWHDGRVAYQGPCLWKTPIEQVVEVIDVGLLGAFRVIQGFLPAMLDGRGGHIVQMGCGFAGPHEARGWLHYYVANNALAELTRGLAAELRGTSVRINAIAPWFVASGPVKRFFPKQAAGALRPAAVASAILTLVSGPLAKNVSGQVLEVRSDSDL